MLSVEAAALRFNDRDYHPTALVRLAAHYLARREAAVAFMFADRRCRITPRAGAQDYALRALCLSALSDHQAARRDFTRAYELDPTDARLNKSILDADFAGSRAELARNIIASPRAEEAAIDTALQVLWQENYQAVLRVSIQSNMLYGWGVWRGDERLSMTLMSSGSGRDRLSEELIFKKDPHHRLSKDGLRATNFAIEIQRNQCAAIDVFDLKVALQPSFVHIDSPRRSSSSREGDDAVPLAEVDLCTVIVPLYGDVEITKACLEQLRRQQATIKINCILVNDHPGHLELHALAEQAQKLADFQVIHNPENLGFARSINRALEQIRVGDVLLLNSDTILPAGGVERLRKAAYSADDIGTVTPLTNNGELTSIPAAFKENPLRSIEDIEAINATLSKANAGLVVTLPTGIGFCLYVKRVALNAENLLPDYYGRGYYEDVDFCLKLRKAGFRNVCAADVYIGHKGGASFTTSKRALVVHNLRVLTSRFPDHSVESAAFMKADPLAATRALVAYAHPETVDDAIVLYGASSSLKAERTAWLRAQKKVIFYLDLQQTGSAKFFLQRSDDDTWTMDFPSDAGGLAKLNAFLQQAHVKKIELSAASTCSNEFKNFILQWDMEAALLFDAIPIKGQSTYHHPCLSSSEGRACARCCEDVSKRMHVMNTQEFFAAISMRSAGIGTVVTNRMAAAVAQKFSLGADSEFQSTATQVLVRPASDVQNVLGILNCDIQIETERLLLALIQYIACIGLDIRVVVIGNALDELRLMSAGNAFVTGFVSLDGYSEVLRNYKIGALLFPQRWEGFGIADRLSDELACPQAYFDWSFGAMSRREKDLSIDPRVCDDAASRKIVSWVQHLFLQ